MTDTALTTADIDRILEGASRRRLPSLATESLWGAQAIADFMGTSADYVRKLSTTDDECPIRIRGGRYYATRTEIAEWLRPKEERRP
ncbi:DNA-binding protein [Martelella limonii]|uniref:DNA-binding protein n=1 Tax=Martelella limonii TaxID=1647649 RepID=UPI00157FFAA3|nr:DNA-binding protein [Martelella limonii]